MPEEEAFCSLVQLMKQYHFRTLYTQDMTGLQLRLYQYNNLLKDTLPVVAKHLEKEGIQSSMYASQWFMTIFAYRFPLEIVFSIMDLIFSEGITQTYPGIDAMFRIALALMKKNRETILTLEFENLLEFLKQGLFDVYETTSANLIIDASAIRIYKSRLDKLQTEFMQKV